MTSRAAIVLPARYHSTRFPGKPLAVLSGKPLIEWVYMRAALVNGVSQVIVATDDARIATVVEAFGGDVVMTTDKHETGTDRVAEVAEKIDANIIVNLQGDEPVFPVRIVERMIGIVDDDDTVDIVTAAHPIGSDGDSDEGVRTNPNVVKVVVDSESNALYFSRSPVPSFAHASSDSSVVSYRHIGIYAFRRSRLLEMAALPRSPLERAECLEQLRALENGMCIRVLVSEQMTLGVDVPDDVKSVEKALTSS